MQMTDNCELLSIFPTPVVKFKVPDEMMRYVPYLQRKAEDFPVKYNGHIVSDDKYVLNDKDYEPLKNWITGRTTEFLRLVLTIDSDALITQSWIIKNTNKQCAFPQSYQNSE